MMEAGSTFTKHSDPRHAHAKASKMASGTSNSNRVVLFFSPGDGIFSRGSLFFCNPGTTRVEFFSQRLDIDDIIEMFPGQVASLYPPGFGWF